MYDSFGTSFTTSNTDWTIEAGSYTVTGQSYNSTTKFV